MINALRVGAFYLLFSLASTHMASAQKLQLPLNGVIPDEDTAVKVAHIMFLPIFGTENVDKFLPYHAQFKNGIWTVYGTLKPGARGGTPMTRIRKKDGKVLEVWHSQ